MTIAELREKAFRANIDVFTLKTCSDEVYDEILDNIHDNLEKVIVGLDSLTGDINETIRKLEECRGTFEE